MSDSPEPGKMERQPTHLRWKPKLRWFAAEIAVVVVGVLIALALNAWWQARQAAAGEENYLTLISRDLGQMLDDLEELRAYEEHQIQGGLEAYRAISTNDRSPEQMTLISDRVQRLTSRRTMNLTNATYQDLLSTGNLQLIGNRALRDQLVAFYEQAEGEFEIHNENNAFIVDQLFATLIEGRGLFLSRGGSGTTINATTGSDSVLTDALAGRLKIRILFGVFPTARQNGRA